MSGEQIDVQRLKTQLYLAVSRPLGDAWVNDDENECETIEALQDRAEHGLASALEAVAEFRRMIGVIRREDKKRKPPAEPAAEPGAGEGMK